MLLFAGTALNEAETTSGSIDTNSVKTSSIAMSAADNADKCKLERICIDAYLWSLYERTRKIDTIKLPGRIKVAVTRKGKTRIVTKKTTKLVDEDFTWTDPKSR